MVVASTDLANIEQLRFFNPTFFRAGEIHNHLPVWERLLSGHSSSQANFFDIVREGVKVDCFFKPFWRLPFRIMVTKRNLSNGEN